MPYIAVSQIAKALESLQRFHPFFGVTFLSMKESGVNTATAIAWGSAQEEALLRRVYQPPGAPVGKKYFVPFGRPESDTGFWRNPKYSGGALQSARTRQDFSKALVHPSKDQWAFDVDYRSKLAALLPGGARLPVFDLIAWLYRDAELPATLEAVEGKFRDDFHLSDDVEYSELFDSTPPESASHFFSPEPTTPEELVSLTSGVPAGPSLGGRTESDLISHLSQWIREEANLTLPPGFLETFYSALKAQRFVVLAGRPGTGKTAFVRAFSDALASFFENCVELVEISVAKEFSEADVIGYEKISGGLSATELTRRLFLSGRPNDIYVILLDEMNLAHVDHYLARILPAFESDSPVELPGESSTKPLPPDAFLIGTVNSYLEESTRLPLSGPVKRRANVIEMPNFLGMLVANGDRENFDLACAGLLKQSLGKVQKRVREGSGSVLDAFRAESLSAASVPTSILRSAEFSQQLWDICRICCSYTSTAPTFGIIQDLLDYVAMSPNHIARSLSDQIAHKIVPQLSGPASVARDLLALVETLETDSGDFSSAKSALDALLRTEDPASGWVMYSY
jgi:hypothetical protein